MKPYLICTIYFLSTIGLAQLDSGKLAPAVTSLSMEPDTVTVVHLADGYATSVKVPEEISSVVIGNPAKFRAEHSEAEPRLVFLKPTTELQCESNALITTKSGKEINLYLVSRGKANASTRVDFFVEYRRPEGFGASEDRQSFLIPETQSLSPERSIEPSRKSIEAQDVIGEELEKQKRLPSPRWEGTELLGAVGRSIRKENQTILGFSILNSSNRVIEVLPPQLELSSTGRGNGVKQIKAEPLAVSKYHMTTQMLLPGQRADGVLVFERPTFKESAERLQLQIVDAARVDRPLLLEVPFTADPERGAQ